MISKSLLQKGNENQMCDGLQLLLLKWTVEGEHERTTKTRLWDYHNKNNHS